MDWDSVIVIWEGRMEGLDMQVFHVVRAALAEVLKVDPESVVAETDVWRDLQVDSLDMVELYGMLEDEWGAGTLNAEQFSGVRTVGDVVTRIRPAGRV